MLIIEIQFFTLTTSWLTSMMLHGQQSGLKWHMTSFTRSTTPSTSTSTSTRSTMMTTQYVFFSSCPHNSYLCSYQQMDDIRGIASLNIFNNLPSTRPLDADALDDELEDYLGTPWEHVTDVISWWYDTMELGGTGIVWRIGNVAAHPSSGLLWAPPHSPWFGALHSCPSSLFGGVLSVSFSCRCGGVLFRVVGGCGQRAGDTASRCLVL